MPYIIEDDPQQARAGRYIIEDAPTPAKLGRASYEDALRNELQNADPFTRNLAGAGTALSSLYQGAKQFFGAGDKNAIDDNRIIADEAPVGSVVGNVALTAIPFGLAGNSIRAGAAVGAGIGALEPVAGDQGFANVARGKLINAGIGGVTGGVGQAIANKAGSYVTGRLAELEAQKAQNAPLNQTLRDAIDAGFVVPPSSVNPSFMNTTLEGVAGKISTAQTASNRNAEVIDSLARRSVGLGENEPLTSEAMKAVRARAYQSGYEPVTNFGPVPTDAAYHKALDEIAAKYTGAAQDFPGAASSAVPDFINGTKQGKINGQFVDDSGALMPKDAIPSPPKLRSLLQEIKQRGGISVNEVGDLNVHALNKDHPGLLRKQGNDGDALVEIMHQQGWINSADLKFADENLTGGAQELARDMLRTAINRERVVHPRDQAAAFEYDNAMKDAAQYGARKATQADIPTTGGLRIPRFDAANGIKMTQILRDEAQAAFRSGDSALGKAKREAAKAIEDQIERAIASNGGAGAEAADLLNNFREARKLMAKSHTVEDAIIEGGGSINARKLASRVQAGKPLEGDLLTIGKFANNFPRATQPAQQVAGPGVSKLNSVAGAVMGGGGALAAGPAGLAAGVLPMVIPPAVRNILLSRASQENQLKRLYELGLTTRAASSFLQYAPVGGTVLGLNAFPQ